MSTNEKPRARGTGQILLDDQSIAKHITAIRKILAKSKPLAGKSSPSNTNEYISEISKMLREQRERRDDAALRLPPLRCGCHDPLRCRCNTKRARR